MAINWGKVIGTGLTVTGAATAAVGFLSPETAAQAVSKLGIDSSKIAGENIAKLAGGALAAAGVTTILASGDKEDKSTTDEEKLKDIQRRMRMAEQELGRDIDGDGRIGGALPPTNNPGRGREP